MSRAFAGELPPVSLERPFHARHAAEMGSGSPEPRVRIVHQDEHLVAVDKPSGLAVHKGWASDPSYALDQTRSALGRLVYPIHRLDRGTSGLLLFALSPESLRAFQRCFTGDAGERVDKTYLALVRGHAPEERLIDYAVRKGERRGPDVPRQSAQTSIRRLGTWERYSLVEAEPHTGRLHQIRRHLSHIAHPIIGDTRYGRGEHNRFFREHFDLHRLALHAFKIGLRHPYTGERLELVLPPSGSLRSTLERMDLWVL